MKWIDCFSLYIFSPIFSDISEKGAGLNNLIKESKKQETAMSIGTFTDKSHQPTDAEIHKAIGSMLPDWQGLVKYIRETYPVQEDFKFLYGKKYGWALRFRVKGKLLTSLYPTDGGFTVQVNLSQVAIAKTRSMKLGQNVKDAIARAKPYPEGQWLFIPVDSVGDVRDIKNLLALRVDSNRFQETPPC
jgi:hypothetical protein